jgi:hypothetical protein
MAQIYVNEEHIFWYSSDRKLKNSNATDEEGRRVVDVEIEATVLF